MPYLESEILQLTKAWETTANKLDRDLMLLQERPVKRFLISDMLRLLSVAVRCVLSHAHGDFAGLLRLFIIAGGCLRAITGEPSGAKNDWWNIDIGLCAWAWWAGWVRLPARTGVSLVA